MKYWIFKCNLEHYRLDARLADPNPRVSWIVTRHRDRISSGDVAFVWQTGEHRGFRAMLKLDSDPEVMQELEAEQKYNRRRDDEERVRVLATIIRRCIYVSHLHLRATPGLQDLSVFHGVQLGTNFPMTPHEAKIVCGLIDEPASCA